MKNTAILFSAGLIFGAAVGAVSFKAAKVNFNAPTEQKVTSEKPETNLSISIDGEEI